MKILDPRRRLLEFRKRLEEMFEGFGEGEVGILTAGPRMNVYEEKNKVVYEFEMPGFDKKDIEVRIENGYLVVEAQKQKREKEERKKTYYYSEIRKTFYRKVPLFEGVDESKVSAKYKDGILKVEIRKPSKAKKAGKRIKVS